MKKALITATNNRSGFHKADNSTFGGIIYQSDFETDHKCNSKSNNPVSTIAQRIMSDQRFDEQCKRNIEIRTANRKYYQQKNIIDE